MYLRPSLLSQILYFLSSKHHAHFQPANTAPLPPTLIPLPTLVVIVALALILFTLDITTPSFLLLKLLLLFSLLSVSLLLRLQAGERLRFSNLFGHLIVVVILLAGVLQPFVVRQTTVLHQQTTVQHPVAPVSVTTR